MISTCFDPRFSGAAAPFEAPFREGCGHMPELIPVVRIESRNAQSVAVISKSTGDQSLALANAAVCGMLERDNVRAETILVIDNGSQRGTQESMSRWSEFIQKCNRNRLGCIRLTTVDHTLFRLPHPVDVLVVDVVQTTSVEALSVLVVNESMVRSTIVLCRSLIQCSDEPKRIPLDTLPTFLSASEGKWYVEVQSILDMGIIVLRRK
jgi:hypothetical protein